MKYKLKTEDRFNFILIKYLRVFMILAVVILGMVGILKIRDIFEQYTLVDILMKYKEKSLFIYFFICFLHPIALPLPEAITIMTGSLIFGKFNTAVIAFLGSILGIISMFLFSRYIGEKFILNIVNKDKLEKFNKYIKKNETLIIFLLFVIPILPDEIICVGSGITGISGYKFIAIAVLSKLIVDFTLSYSIGLFSFKLMSIIIAIIAILFAIIKHMFV